MNKLKSNVKNGKIITIAVMLVFTLLLASCGSKDEKKAEETTKASGGSPKVVEEGVFKKFTAKNIDGSQADESIFKDNKYTIVDAWGSFCNPCIKAMPDMEKLYQKYKSKGVGMVGILVDGKTAGGEENAEVIKTANDIVKKQGATYKNILIPNEVASFMGKVTVVPTAFIVDKSGNVVSEMYQGAMSVEQWEKIIDEKLGIK